MASRASAPGPITVIEVKRSIRARASLKRLFCKPSPKLTIVTIAATPTTTPMTVNEVLSLACRRLRHASAMMSANFIRSTRNYLAVFKPDDARRESVRQFPVMRHQNDGFAVAPAHFVQHAQHFGGAAAVEIARGFVRQQDLRFVGYGARDADALLFTARKFRREVVGALQQSDSVEQFQRPSSPLGFAQPGESQRERDVLARGHRRNQIEALKDHPDAAKPVT